MSKKNTAPRLGSAVGGIGSLLASLTCILVGLVIGFVVLLVLGWITLAQDGNSLTFGQMLTKTWNSGFKAILSGGFYSTANAMGMGVRTEILQAAPLVMTGLSVAFAFKTGLFNIGAPGQYLMGTLVSLSVALGIPSESVPVGIIWLLAFLGGMLAGALWGAIPGLLKALLNINEVLACIMTNWIAANLVTWMFDISSFKNVTEGTKSGYIYKTTFNGVATPKLGLDQLFPGSQVNAGILVAIILAIVVYIIMEKTVFGYELKACGANRHAARYAGIPDKRNIVLSMAIAGALAGAGAALYWLSGNTEFYWNTYQALPGVGFNGIPVALLAVNNPIAVIFTGIFMAMLDIVGLQLTNLTAYNEYITDVIISVIVYLSAFSLLIQMMLTGRKKKLVVEANKTTTADIPAEAETQPLDVPPEDIPDIPMEEAPQVLEQPEEGGEQA